MLDDLKKFFFESKKKNEYTKTNHKIDSSCEKVTDFFRREFNYSADLVIRKIDIFGVSSCIISMDGMINKDIMNEIMKSIIHSECTKSCSENV